LLHITVAVIAESQKLFTWLSEGAFRWGSTIHQTQWVRTLPVNCRQGVEHDIARH